MGLCGGFSAEVRAKKMRQDGRAEFISGSIVEEALIRRYVAAAARLRGAAVSAPLVRCGEGGRQWCMDRLLSSAACVLSAPHDGRCVFEKLFTLYRKNDIISVSNVKRR